MASSDEYKTISIFMKESKCNNDTGISLPNLTYTVYAKLISIGLKRITERWTGSNINISVWQNAEGVSSVSETSPSNPLTAPLLPTSLLPLDNQIYGRVMTIDIRCTVLCKKFERLQIMELGTLYEI